MPQNDEHVERGGDDALDRFKWEVAEELGLAARVRQVGWENMTTREAGKVGGQMVKRMIEAAEQSLRAHHAGDPRPFDSDLGMQ